MKAFPIIILSFIICFDLYLFSGIKNTLSAYNSKIVTISYALLSAFILGGVLFLFSSTAGALSSTTLTQNLIFGTAFALIVAKIITGTIFLSEDVLRLIRWLIQSVSEIKFVGLIARSKMLGFFSIGLGSIFFLLLTYGVLHGRYDFKIYHTDIYFDDLPEAYDGLTLAQLSDLHLGTFDNKKQVQRGLQMLQDQNPDVILFTGDMVNNLASEAVPYIDLFRALSAPYGKFSVLGNHDYAEYVRWESEAARNENIEQLKEIHRQMGFRLLNNEQALLTKGNDSLRIAGVENWGTPPFPQYGDLRKALWDNPNTFTILLSHDPTHWEAQVLQNEQKVNLTLSGHTHGMQFGFEMGKFRWSPVKYRYPRWAGLYNQIDQYLYVNRGFGHIGYPGRVGIRPEISLITLHKK